MKKITQIIKNYSSFIILLIVLAPFRFYGVAEQLENITNFRQAQTATITLNFYKNGIDMLQTELDIFGMGKERYLTLEFPLYQALVTIFYRLFFVSDMWGRVVSIVAGLFGAIFLYKLIILLYGNKKAALFTCFFFLIAPVNMFHQRDFLIESAIICFLLAGLYFSCHWVKKLSVRSYLLAITFFTLGFIQKGMYGPFWLIPFSWYYFTKHKGEKKTIFRYVLLIVIPLITLFVWQQHVNYINTISGHEYFTTHNTGHLLWNFGTFTDRLSASMWRFRLNNLLNGIVLKPGIFLFLLGMFFARKIRNSSFMYIWLLSEAAYFLIFFSIQSHIYYQMVIVPVVSFFMAIGLIAIGTYIYGSISRLNINQKQNKIICSAFIAFTASVLLWRSWISSQWDTQKDRNWYERLKKVGSSVPKESFGIFVNPGYDWNSVYTYYPKIKVMLITVEDFSSENIEWWKKQGYKYIILHDYREYPAYLTKNKPGHSIAFISRHKEILSLEDFKVYLLD